MSELPQPNANLDDAIESLFAMANDNSEGVKRPSDDCDFAAGGMISRPTKVARIEQPEFSAQEAAKVAAAAVVSLAESTKKQAKNAQEDRELLPHPFYYYRDHSTDEDPDPLAPLTFPGQIPNFPAKMHAILSRPDLQDIVSWMDHGRSWRVLKPREFEVKVIPTYFEHAKFSSFVRQANGWGFRRITQGPDRNSYYHELFLRGLPHLCKSMRRPGVAEKKAANPDQEPDFYRISEMHPLPEKASDASILLPSTVQGGPKARMPVMTGSVPSETNMAPAPLLAPAPPQNITVPPTGAGYQPIAPQVTQVPKTESPTALQMVAPQVTSPSPASQALAPVASAASEPVAHCVSPLTAPTLVPFDMAQLMSQHFAQHMTSLHTSGQAPPAFDPTAAAQFAAGFAMATAFSQQHFSSMFSQQFQQPFQQPQMQPPQQQPPQEAQQQQQ